MDLDTTESVSSNSEEAEDQQKNLVTPTSREGGLSIPEKIRAELNLERWPQIFAAPHSKNKTPRTYTRNHTHDDGTREVVSVTVDYSTKVGTLTTQDRKTLYALYALRSNYLTDHPDHSGPIRFSVRELSKVLGAKGWGRTTFREIRNSLERLNAVHTWWVGSFYDRAEGTYKTIRTGLNILSTLMIVENFQKHQLTLELGAYRFHELIEANLQRNHTTPRFLETALEIRGEIASALYALLDLIMADKTHAKISLAKLYGPDYLDLSGTYRFASKRAEKIKPAIEELDGKPCSTGTLYLRLEPTKDRRDFNLIIRKKLAGEDIPATAEHRPTRPRYAVTDPQLIALLANDLVEFTHDPGHLTIYQCAARLYGADVIYQAISEAKEQRDLRLFNADLQPIRNLGAYTVAVASRLAREGRNPRPTSNTP